MGFVGKDVSEEKQTDFTFKGLPLLLIKTRGRPPSGKMAVGKTGWWSEKKRIEATTLFAATGNFSEVSRLSGVPAQTLKSWSKEDWFLRLLEDIRAENDQQIDAKFSKIVNTALDQVLDRLENGDTVLLRDGSAVKKPIGARDLSQITSMNVDKRQLLRGKPTSRTEKISENDRLQKLENMFLKLAEKKTKPPEIIQDVEFIEVKNDPDA